VPQEREESALEAQKASDYRALVLSCHGTTDLFLLV